MICSYSCALILEAGIFVHSSMIRARFSMVTAGLGLLFQLLDLRRQLHQLAADESQTLIVLILRILLVEHPQFQLVVVPLLFQLGKLGNLACTAG